MQEYKNDILKAIEMCETEEIGSGELDDRICAAMGSYIYKPRGYTRVEKMKKSLGMDVSRHRFSRDRNTLAAYEVGEQAGGLEVRSRRVECNQKSRQWCVTLKLSDETLITSFGKTEVLARWGALLKCQMLTVTEAEEIEASAMLGNVKDQAMLGCLYYEGNVIWAIFE